MNVQYKLEVIVDDDACPFLVSKYELSEDGAEWNLRWTRRFEEWNQVIEAAAR